VNTLGDEVRRLREAKGISQASLAESIGVNQSFISQIEKGRRKGLHDVVQFFRLADALGVTVEHFRPFLSIPVIEEKPEQDPEDVAKLLKLADSLGVPQKQLLPFINSDQSKPPAKKPTARKPRTK